MLTNPTIETLKALKLQGMIQALEEQQQNPAVNALSFEERVALIVDRERLYRDNQRRTRLLRGAHLKVAAACVEDINYKAARGLDKRQIAALAGGEWIRRSQNLLITGATGSGKTWLACALAQQACRQGGISALLARSATHRGTARRPRRRQLHQVPENDREVLAHRAR
jgi:DNA replication protein DnaC